MKNIKLILVFTCLFLIGCETASNSKKIQSRKDNISQINEQFTENANNKLEEISTYAAGTKYSLEKIEDPSIEVTTAIEINDRVTAIAGNPNIKEVDKIKSIVDLLTSEIDKDREKGLIELRNRDNKILALQVEMTNIQNEYNNQIDLLKKEAAIVAAKADKYEATIDEVNSYMGLGGVAYGLKKFVSQGLSILVIISIVFIILKIAAKSNPIAASAFYIFETIGGYIIAAIKGLLPNSTTSINLVESKYKDVLNKIVSIVQSYKVSKTKDNSTLSDLLNTFSTELNEEHKNTINEVKREIKKKI